MTDADRAELREVDPERLIQLLAGPDLAKPVRAGAIDPDRELTELELLRWYNARLTRLLLVAQARVRELEQAPDEATLTDQEHAIVLELRSKLDIAEKQIAAYQRALGRSG